MEGVETAEAAEVPQGEATEQAGQVDLGPLTERLDQLSQDVSTFGERFTPIERAFAAGPETGQQETERVAQGPDLGFDPQRDDLYDPQVLDRVLSTHGDRVRDEMRQEFQQLLGPIQQENLMRSYDELASEFPALATEEGAGPVMTEAKRIASLFGAPADQPPHPDIVRMVYLAQKGGERAEQETPAGAQQEGQLERGGATPPEPQQDQFERLREQRREPGKDFWNLA